MGRRAVLHETGWESDLRIEETEPREPTGDQVAVEIEACGVCYRDCIDRSGRFPFIQLPVAPGHEAVGRVRAVGPEVEDWSVGDRVATLHRDACGECARCRTARESSLCDRAYWVFGLMQDGGYATHVVAPQRAFYRAPDHLPPEHAAVLHCTFGTAWRGLHALGAPASGGSVLVTGANGGVGTAAVRVSSALGLEVTAVVRSDEHVEPLRALGAVEVLVTREANFHKQLVRKVDLALDCVGSATFNASLRCVRMGGGVVAIGNIATERVPLNLGYLIVNGIRVAGSSGATREDMEAVVRLDAEHPLHAPIHDRVPLAEADSAQRRVRAGGLRGRIVLMP